MDNNYNTRLNYLSSTNFLDIHEEIVTTIDSPEFDIFQFEKTVGKDNTLSSLSCYIFITNGYYSVVNYTHFENFLDLITKGYTRKSPNHNDLHAADVEQTCYIYLKYGEIKDVK
jgi:hypothetical protein